MCKTIENISECIKKSSASEQVRRGIKPGLCRHWLQSRASHLKKVFDWKRDRTSAHRVQVSPFPSKEYFIITNKINEQPAPTAVAYILYVQVYTVDIYIICGINRGINTPQGSQHTRGSHLPSGSDTMKILKRYGRNGDNSLRGEKKWDDERWRDGEEVGGGCSLARSESGHEPTTSLPSVTPSQVSPAAEDGSSNEGWKVLNRLRRHFGSAGTWK